MAAKIAIWHFVKDPTQLPSVALTGAEWIAQLRARLSNLLVELGDGEAANINQTIRKTGLDEAELTLPLFRAQALFPPIRQATIHQVKGESIDGVLVIGSAKFWNAVVTSIEEGKNTEDRRLAYVAMTRARHLLVLGLPARHYDRHSAKWSAWGFRTL
jgi:superfamily I DNA/RNA helicase